MNTFQVGPARDNRLRASVTILQPMLTPFQRVVRRERWRRFVLLAIGALLLAFALDRAGYRLLSIKPMDAEMRQRLSAGALARGESWTADQLHPKWAIEQSQFYQMLRLIGFLPTWLAIALGIDLVRRRRLRDAPIAANPASRDRGTVLPGMLVCLLAAGLLVELLKVLIGRERPNQHAGEWVFKPLLGGVTDGSNLSTPSSHAAIALVGAFAMARLRPGSGVVAIPLAVGCASTRVLMGAHFLSDIVLSGVLAWLIVEVILPRERCS